jgi:GTP cyclohydrolase-4
MPGVGGNIALPDIQAEKLDNSFKLTRVGITGVKKPVHVKRPNRVVMLTVNIDVFVDLPANQKGSHMSRHVEVINEIVDQSVRKPVESLENLCNEIASILLHKHEYANDSEVNITSDYFLEKQLPSGIKSLESYKIMGRAKARRGNSINKKMIGVEVVGMNACPCAMETIREYISTDHPEFKDKLKTLPTMTHNQRNISSLMIEVPSNYLVEADDLIEIVEDSMSSPTFEILKRADEADVVYSAHTKPRFVEDVVREILTRVLQKFPDLPDDVFVTVRSESEESIHKHNAYAERITSLGELRA